ncbi:hypothetical protein DOY81_003015 [Sarcophaga bullata]|nr:hypothetical protein DOY81_003015 [Sarcophaga bullata]
MNTQFHTPSFGDDAFDLGDASTSTPSGSMLAGSLVNNSFAYQQQTPTSTQTKRMINLHNTTDEYHTANEDSFNFTANNSINQSITQQQQITTTPNNVAAPAGNITPTSGTGPTTMAARKQMLPLDQNEPAKPLSAYALFFRDTVSAIKQQNPTCSFQELSKIVASMWDALDPVHKSVYNKKNELAKTEYLKQMRTYQQQQQLKQEQLNANASNTTAIQQQQQQQQPQNNVTAATANVISNQPTQQNVQVLNNNNNMTSLASATNTAAPATINNAATTATNAGNPASDPNNLAAEAGSLQKCTRENCNKRAIINPDWEDEYCSNECVVIHCRNVFNAWVQSNLEAKQQQTQQQQLSQQQQNQQPTSAT